MKWPEGRKNLLGLFGLLCAVVLLAGCYQASRSGRLHPDADDSLGGTGIDSADVRAVAERMVRSMLDVPDVGTAASPPRVAILPVKNRTRFQIDPAVFTVLMRDTLNEHAAGKIVFLSPEMMDKLRRADGQIDIALVAEQTGAKFCLTGELHAISKATGSGVSDWIVYSFYLADTQYPFPIVWSRQYQTKKEGLWGVVYQ